MKPILKWAGGKQQLLPEIRKRIPKQFNTYFEPFLGGGAVLLDLQPERFVISDINSELINLYKVIESDLQALISELRHHKEKHCEEYYYSVRVLDRGLGYERLSSVERAARTLYLNKTCFNGLYRVNKKGQFNTPFGKYKNPNIVNKEGLQAVSDFLNNSDGLICSDEYKRVLRIATEGDFVYLDPPYDVVKNTSFTGYTKGGFGKQEHLEVKKTCDTLNAKGVKFLLSNSATLFILDLYKDYQLDTIQSRRSINSNGNGRGKVSEVLIKNY